MIDLPLYFDYAASTPILPEVCEAMLPYMQWPLSLGAPSSPHVYGSRTEQAISVSREQVAEVLHAHPLDIIFTSGATESINLALKGVMQVYGDRRPHVVTFQTEHKAVTEVCLWLKKRGFSVTVIPSNQYGTFDVDEFLRALTPKTALCSVLHVNNETGVIQNVHRIAEACRERGVLCHVDAAQSFGKLALDMTKTPIDLLSCTAHKCYGPKGVGALYVRSKPPVRVAAQLHGGGQERNRRSGTLAVHQIVGMGAAAEYAHRHRERYLAYLRSLREAFLNHLCTVSHRVHGGVASGDAGDTSFFGADGLSEAYPGIVNLALKDYSSEFVLNALPEFAFSSVSACQGKSQEGSSVLKAMGYSENDARQAIRISFGWQTTFADVNAFASALCAL